MVRAAILNFEHRATRQHHRRRLGTLKTNLVKRITVDRYNHHFNIFVDYLLQVYGRWPVTPPEYDMIVAEYLEVLWDSGDPKTSATYTLASLHYFIPQLRRQLPRSWKLKAIWDKLELPCQAVPLSLEVLFGIVGFFLRHEEFPMAFGCLLGFNSLLRTGELLQLEIVSAHLMGAFFTCKTPKELNVASFRKKPWSYWTPLPFVSFSFFHEVKIQGTFWWDCRLRSFVQNGIK